MSDMIIRIAVGALFFAVGIFLFLKQRRNAQNCTEKVTAEVTGYVTETHTDSDNVDTEVYYPVMRYCVSDKWYESKSDVGKGSRKYEVGDRVEILFDPSKPECFILPGDKTNLIVSVVFALAGIGLIIFGFIG